MWCNCKGGDCSCGCSHCIAVLRIIGELQGVLKPVEKTRSERLFEKMRIPQRLKMEKGSQVVGEDSDNSDDEFRTFVEEDELCKYKKNLP